MIILTNPVGIWFWLSKKGKNIYRIHSFIEEIEYKEEKNTEEQSKWESESRKWPEFLNCYNNFFYLNLYSK
jgi:hypothetical protein